MNTKSSIEYREVKSAKRKEHMKYYKCDLQNLRVGSRSIWNDKILSATIGTKNIGDLQIIFPEISSVPCSGEDVVDIVFQTKASIRVYFSNDGPSQLASSFRVGS